MPVERQERMRIRGIRPNVGGRRGGRNGDGKTGGSSGGYGIGRRSGMGNGSGDGGSQGAEDVNGDRPSGLTKVKVVGARRVWGTMSMCTTSTVQNVIRRVCGLSSVRVREKTKMSPSGKQKWWFVLDDEEPTLHVLEDKWESVEMQTSWKLESCFQPIATDETDDGAVVPGDAVAHVLDSEVSTVVTTSVSTPATLTHSSQSASDMQPMPVRVQSHSCNVEGAVGPDDEHSFFCSTALPFKLKGIAEVFKS
jgi:hypothetical protein